MSVDFAHMKVAYAGRDELATLYELEGDYPELGYGSVFRASNGKPYVVVYEVNIRKFLIKRVIET